MAKKAIARHSGAHPPDIVLASIATRKRTGYDVAALREIGPGPCLDSGPAAGRPLSNAIDQVRAAQVRCDGVLVKPLEPRQVVARVKELIAVRHGKHRYCGLGSAERRWGLTSPSSSSDDYFDQLDAAFAQRSAPVPRLTVRRQPASSPRSIPC